MNTSGQVGPKCESKDKTVRQGTVPRLDIFSAFLYDDIEVLPYFKPVRQHSKPMQLLPVSRMLMFYRKLSGGFMYTVEDKRSIACKGLYDVIVAGGGIAGAAAALAAAREGVKVLLIEKSVMLGGLATIGLISWYEPLCNQQGKKIIGGISEELLRLAIKYGPDDLP